MQEGSTVNNKKMKKKLRTVVLSNNVNDYDTGEIFTLYKRQNDPNLTNTSTKTSLSDYILAHDL